MIKNRGKKGNFCDSTQRNREKNGIKTQKIPISTKYILSQNDEIVNSNFHFLDISLSVFSASWCIGYFICIFVGEGPAPPVTFLPHCSPGSASRKDHHCHCEEGQPLAPTWQSPMPLLCAKATSVIARSSAHWRGNPFPLLQMGIMFFSCVDKKRTKRSRFKRGLCTKTPPLKNHPS